MQVIYIHLKVRKIIKMTVKFQPKGGICEPSSDTPLNWSDMRSVLGYKLLGEIFEFFKRRLGMR